MLTPLMGLDQERVFSCFVGGMERIQSPWQVAHGSGKESRQSGFPPTVHTGKEGLVRCLASGSVIWEAAKEVYGRGLEAFLLPGLVA